MAWRATHGPTRDAHAAEAEEGDHRGDADRLIAQDGMDVSSNALLKVFEPRPTRTS
jgi:hypothetical protein